MQPASDIANTLRMQLSDDYISEFLLVFFHFHTFSHVVDQIQTNMSSKTQKFWKTTLMHAPHLPSEWAFWSVILILSLSSSPDCIHPHNWTKDPFKPFFFQLCASNLCEATEHQQSFLLWGCFSPLTRTCRVHRPNLFLPQREPGSDFFFPNLVKTLSLVFLFLAA